MQRFPELLRAPAARPRPFVSAFIRPAGPNALAALLILAPVFMEPAHVRLEPGVKHRRSHRLQEFADPIAPAELLLRRSRSDEIHRAGKVHSRALQQTAFRSSLRHRGRIKECVRRARPGKPRPPGTIKSGG